MLARWASWASWSRALRASGVMAEDNEASAACCWARSGASASASRTPSRCVPERSAYAIHSDRPRASCGSSGAPARTTTCIRTSGSSERGTTYTVSPLRSRCTVTPTGSPGNGVGTGLGRSVASTMADHGSAGASMVAVSPRSLGALSPCIATPAMARAIRPAVGTSQRTHRVGRTTAAVSSLLSRSANEGNRWSRS